MPAVQIDIRQQYPHVIEIGIIDAVHNALREAFQLPETDRDIRLVVHEPHRFACPPHLLQPELFTFISIDCFAGRSLDTKRALYRLIVEKLHHFSIPSDHIKIILRESALENWGIQGGQAACDVDLGFQVNL